MQRNKAGLKQPGPKILIYKCFERFITQSKYNTDSLICFDFGTFQQFDEQLVKQVVAAFEPARVEHTYFRYTSAGWDFSTPEACADAEYVEWTALPPDQRPAVFPDHPDRAAAARAVVCLLLVKPS